MVNESQKNIGGEIGALQVPVRAQVSPIEEVKTPKLTLKQQKWLKVYFETGNATKATLSAYDVDDPKIAATMGVENRIKLKDVVQRIMEKKGLDIQHLVGTVYNATEATKWNDFTGEREADHATRLKAVEVANKWLGIDKREEDYGNVKRKIVATEFFES